jgi:hypothetical protein
MVELFEWRALSRVLVSVFLLSSVCAVVAHFSISLAQDGIFAVTIRLCVIASVAVVMMPLFHIMLGIWNVEVVRENCRRIASKFRR